VQRAKNALLKQTGTEFKMPIGIKTRPQCDDYDQGFESTFGKKCFYCRQQLDPSKSTEWTSGTHETCAKARELTE
jgi:hypothetical protein